MWVLFLIPARLGEKSGDRGEVKGCNNVVRVLFLIPARGGDLVGGDEGWRLSLDTAVMWVLFLIPAGLGEKSGGRGGSCCLMLQWCGYYF